MGRGINKVILVGNLGGDPELRQTNNGTSVCNFNLATSFVRRNAETGETTETTEWHRVVLFKRLAEIAEQYLKKGDQAYIEGRLSTRKWQDREGNDRWTTEVIGSELQMLGSPRGGQRGGPRDSQRDGQRDGGGGSGNYRPPQERGGDAGYGSGSSGGGGGGRSAGSGQDGFEDDDIPF